MFGDRSIVFRTYFEMFGGRSIVFRTSFEMFEGRSIVSRTSFEMFEGRPIVSRRVAEQFLDGSIVSRTGLKTFWDGTFRARTSGKSSRNPMIPRDFRKIVMALALLPPFPRSPTGTRAPLGSRKKSQKRKVQLTYSNQRASAVPDQKRQARNRSCHSTRPCCTAFREFQPL
jgi:hypothetical protein